MVDTKKLTGLCQKLKSNRDKVPLEVLKSKYRIPYEKLLAEIQQEAKEVVSKVGFKPPWYLENVKINSIIQEKLVNIFGEVYAEGDYGKRIGKALFQNYDTGEAVKIAEQLNRDYLEKLEAKEFFHEGTGIFITEANGIRDGTTPKVYNEFINMFWEEEKGWRDPKPGETEEQHCFWYNSFCKLINEGMERKKKEASRQ